MKPAKEVAAQLRLLKEKVTSRNIKELMLPFVDDPNDVEDESYVRAVFLEHFQIGARNAGIESDVKRILGDD